MTFQPKTNSLSKAEHEALMAVLQNRRLSFVLLLVYLCNHPDKFQNEIGYKLIRENETQLRDFMGMLPSGWKLEQ